ncbi:MAG: hypothetical protein JSV21_05485 [Nitrospirota bacterium]|nr:MAG: hypothetical protein JSV21_05485 [Nitrospirota bacterium]
MELKHSGLGISSFITSIISGLAMFFLVIIAAMMESAGGIDEESAQAIILGLFVIGFLFLSLISFGLGIAGLLQKNRKKIFAILGTVFSGVTLFGTIFLMVLGIVAG